MQIEELKALLEDLETHGVFPVLSEPAQTAFIHALEDCGWKCHKNTNDEWEISQKPTHTAPRPSLNTFQKKYDEALAPEEQWHSGNSTPPDKEDFVTLRLINLQALMRPNPKAMLAPTAPAPALLLSEDAARILKITLQDKEVELRDNISRLAHQNALTDIDRNRLQEHLNQMTPNDQNAFMRYFNLQTNGPQLQTPQQNQMQARVHAIQKATSMVMGLPPEHKESVKHALIESLSGQEPSSRVRSPFLTKPKPYHPY